VGFMRAKWLALFIRKPDKKNTSSAYEMTQPVQSQITGGGQMNSIISIALVCVVLVAPSVPIEAQQTSQPKRIGFVRLGSLPDPNGSQLREGLRELGWIEGKNLIVEIRYAGGNLDRLAEIAAELVRLRVDVLVTASVPATLVLKKATRSIPIVVAAAT